MTTRSGYAALVGWTNVGKSTLLNRLVGAKLAAVADVAQTTRHRITGVVCDPQRGQIVFVDTPGLHRPRFRMNRNMVQLTEATVTGVDVVLLVVDASRSLGPGDRQSAELVRQAGVESILILNKVDRVQPKSRLLPLMAECSEAFGFETIVPVSALKGDGCDDLLESLWQRMPEGPPVFPEEYLTDQPERVLAAEYVREQLLHATREELPHASAVAVEKWEETEGLVRIHAVILVERESQKPIVIGSGGQRLKEIGTAARKEIEALLERRVALNLWVQVRPQWRESQRVLRELGLDG